MSLKFEEIKEAMKQENLSFNQKIDFAEETAKGEFEGILVKYENAKLAHGCYRFAKESMKVNDDKQLFILYQHMGSLVPVGTMTGVSDNEGFKVKAKLDLTLLENGNPVNAAAHALYSLMKNQGAKFDLSVGGKINVREYVEKNNERFINIKEFEAHEGSIVMVGAVEGSKITKVFSDDTKNKKTSGGNVEMEKELLELITGKFAALESKMLNADNEKQIVEFKAEFEKFKAEFSALSTELKSEFSTRMEEINDIAKKLESNYTATPEEIGAAAEIMVMFNAAEKTGASLSCYIPGQEINVKESFANVQDYEKFAATTAGLPSAIKPTYITKILERIQDSNPFLRRISFMPITDNSLQIPREVLGLPTCLWVGETDTRSETDGDRKSVV